MGVHIPLRISKILLLADAVLPLAFYIALQSRSRDLPCYMDVVISLGAGSRLAFNGHLSSTFMLYGLLNPFLHEIVILAGGGELISPD